MKIWKTEGQFLSQAVTLCHHAVEFIYCMYCCVTFLLADVTILSLFSTYGRAPLM